MPPIPNSDFAAASICVLSVLNQRDVHHHPDRVVGIGQRFTITIARNGGARSPVKPGRSGRLVRTGAEKT